MNIKLLVPFLLFVGLCFILVFGLKDGRDPKLIPSPLIGKPAPDFALPSLSDPDQIITKQQLLGKPYLLNVWASWCYACRIEHPEISRISKTGIIDIYGLNYRNDANEAKKWLRQFGNPYTANLSDTAGNTAIDFGVYGAPETFLIDAEGIIRYKYVGPLNARDETGKMIFDRQIKPLLK